MLGHVLHFRLAAFYSAADLFVLGSHDEGSGYAVLEACACGASPVVTDIPSFRRMTAGAQSVLCGRQGTRTIAPGRSLRPRAVRRLPSGGAFRITSRAT